MSSPALVIAGTYSGVGTTTISIALMAALRRCGLRVQRGHESRYSVIDEMPEHIGRRYRVSTMAGERQEGFTVGRVLASYVHLHFGSCPRFAARFVAACAGS